LFFPPLRFDVSLTRVNLFSSRSHWVIAIVITMLVIESYCDSLLNKKGQPVRYRISWPALKLIAPRRNLQIGLPPDDVQKKPTRRYRHKVGPWPDKSPVTGGNPSGHLRI
jgi:hypothetical protein